MTLAMQNSLPYRTGRYTYNGQSAGVSLVIDLSGSTTVNPRSTVASTAGGASSSPAVPLNRSAVTVTPGNQT